MIEANHFTLDNGLRVVHSHNPLTAMVTVNILYNTGARDERPRQTGIAHLFEHLMFGGTDNVPSFDATLELAGGTNNAATGNDFTEFYDILPAQNAETAFYVESDRMLGLSFSDKALDVQRSVVIEEFKQVCLNRPYGQLYHVLRPLLYSDHPYRWPVIGITPQHIADTTQQDIRNWFYSHYAPNNAILSVVGNITLEQTRIWVEKWFGDIPRRDIAPRILPDDPRPTRIHRQTVIDPTVPQPLIAIAYRMDPYGTRGYYSADAITDILSAGKSSRLNRRLVLGTDLYSSADASITGSEHSGMLLMVARINSNDSADIDRACDMLIDQAKALAIPGDVSDYELQRAKNRYEATFTFDNMSDLNLAQNLALATYHGEDINDNVPRYQSLTLDDITNTARDLFVDHAPAIVVIRPAE